MLPTVVNRSLMILLGQVLPAYFCFKAMRRRRIENDELVFWCRYWVLLAAFGLLECFLDAIVFWLPMYQEAKIAFVVALWHPRTKGTDYAYDQLLLPLLTKHEKEIDNRLVEIEGRMTEAAVTLWERACSYVHDNFDRLLAYLAGLAIQAAQQSAMNSGQDNAPPIGPHVWAKVHQVREVQLDAEPKIPTADASSRSKSHPRLHDVEEEVTEKVVVAERALDMVQVKEEVLPVSYGVREASGMSCGPEEDDLKDPTVVMALSADKGQASGISSFTQRRMLPRRKASLRNPPMVPR